ncbi:MAG: WD40 repeat domain-containing protein [Anaerolineales bacterium]
MEYTVNHLTWSPDGMRLATAGHSGRVAILDGESGELLQSLEGEGRQEPVRALAWSPAGAWLAVADGRSRLHLFETESWTKLHLESTRAGYHDHLVWSSDGREVALGREEWVKVWTVPSGRSTSLGTRQIYGDDLCVFTWSPDGKRIFSYTLYGEEAQIWHIESGDFVPISVPLWEALWHALF